MLSVLFILCKEALESSKTVRNLRFGIVRRFMFPSFEFHRVQFSLLCGIIILSFENELTIENDTGSWHDSHEYDALKSLWGPKHLTKHLN